MLPHQSQTGLTLENMRKEEEKKNKKLWGFGKMSVRNREKLK